MMAMTHHSILPRLAELLRAIPGVPALPEHCAALAVSGLTLDSRRVAAGDVFFACAGGRVHGRTFIDQAIAAGASAVLEETATGQEASVRWHSAPGENAGANASVNASAGRKVPVVEIPALSQQVGVIAERFYGEPSRHLLMVGVTGTNGKTSVSHFLAHALQAAGGETAASGLLGTLGNGLVGALAPASHTTPDAITLHALLAQLRERGARSVVMEVSSHGLEQGRVNGVAFDTAVFTNLSRDHLDYHGDMAAYGRAKQRLFTWPGLHHAVINSDDAFGRELLSGLPAGVNGVAYGLDEASLSPAPGGTLLGRIRRQDTHGLCLEVDGSWGRGEVETRLLGRFNASNLLAVLGVLLAHGLALDTALASVRELPQVPGRMECFGGNGHPLVVVDYAHTPDALVQVLEALRAHTDGRLWCVFGCGGERDTGKRAEMGAAAERLADFVMLTDDNPRREDPWTIIAGIQAGLRQPDAAYVERDRARAIERVLSLATAGDVVLVAGKGHEDYQLVGDERRDFSDIEQVCRHVARWQAEEQA